jgi:hypothetical protein
LFVSAGVEQTVAEIVQGLTFEIEIARSARRGGRALEQAPSRIGIEIPQIDDLERRPRDATMIVQLFVNRQRARRVLERRGIVGPALEPRQQVGRVGDPRAVAEPLENGKSLGDAGTPRGRARSGSRDLAETQLRARDVRVIGCRARVFERALE